MENNESSDVVSSTSTDSKNDVELTDTEKIIGLAVVAVVLWCFVSVDSVDSIVNNLFYNEPVDAYVIESLDNSQEYQTYKDIPEIKNLLNKYKKDGILQEWEYNDIKKSLDELVDKDREKNLLEANKEAAKKL